MNKQEYDKMLGINQYEPVYVSPKKRKQNQVKWTYGYNQSQIRR